MIFLTPPHFSAKKTPISQSQVWVAMIRMITGPTSGGKVTLDQVSFGIAQSHAPLSIPMLLIPLANLVNISFSHSNIKSLSSQSPEISVLSPVGPPTVSDHPELLPSLLSWRITTMRSTSVTLMITVSHNRDVMVDGGEVGLVLKYAPSVCDQLISDSHT